MSWIRSDHNYTLVVAKPFLCVGAVLQMILAEIGYNKYDQEDLIDFFDLWLPENHYKYHSNANLSDESRDWGVHLKYDTINNLFNHLKIPLTEKYYPVDTVEDWNMADLIADNMVRGHHLICGYVYGSLFNKPDNKAGHVSLINGIFEDKKINVIDPGPDDPGEKEVDFIKLYKAMKEKKDGLWVIK